MSMQLFVHGALSQQKVALGWSVTNQLYYKRKTGQGLQVS